MKVSQFALVVNDFPTVGTTLIYHTLTNKDIVLRGASARVIRTPNAETNHPPTVRTLVEMGLLVDDDADEFATALAHQANKKRPVINIAPTLECNNRCTYCIQQQVPTASLGVMDGPTLSRSVEFIEEWIRVRNDQLSSPWTVVIYGGEPLLQKKSVLFIARRLADFSARSGVSIRLLLITNGILLDRPFVEELTGYLHCEIELSFDGFGESHDRRRLRANGRGTFSETLAAFKMLIDFPSASCGLNLQLQVHDQGSADDLHHLLDYFRVMGAVERGAVIHMRPIWLKGVPAVREITSSALAGLRRHALQLGFNAAIKTLGSCNVLANDGWLPVCIAPDGSVYDCTNAVGLDETRIGSVLNNEGAIVSDRVHRLFHEHITAGGIHPKCRICSLVPDCETMLMRVCPVIKTLYGGFADDDFFGRSCGMEYRRSVLVEFLKIDYFHRQANFVVIDDSP